MGEIKSVLPLIEKIEKNKNVNQILITSNTLSSSKILQNLKVKKNCSPIFSDRYNFLMQKIFKLLETIFSFFYELGDLA